MLRKLTLIFVLAILFGAFLIIRPYINKPADPPTIEDRLPDADFMATIDCIRLAREVSGLMFYYKVSYRDFLSPEFILSQAKSYGLNIQKPSYLFANSTGEFGVLTELIDSTRLQKGLDKFKYFFEVKELKINKQKVLKVKGQKSYLFYGNDYLCYYQGDSIVKQINRICQAKPNQVSPSWVELLNQKQYIDKSAILISKLADFKELHIDHVIAYPTFDSTSVYFNTQLTSTDTLPFTLKESGPDFIQGAFTKLAINLHIDPTYLKEHPEHPLYKYLLAKRTRIHFPFKEFIDNWGGDLAFHQGGWINFKQQFIESEIDDEFNITEVTKVKESKVLGFSLFYSLNEKSNNFRNLMLKKGFLTEQENKYYLLLSPPLNYKGTNSTDQLFYSSGSEPKMIQSDKSYVMWSHKQTKYTAQIDSINTFNFYGSVSFSLKNILINENLTDED